MMQYAEPTTIAETLSLLAAAPPGGARILAGGTDLVLRLRQRLLPEPGLLVSLRRVEALRRIEVGADEVLLGPAATVSDLLFSRELAEALPLLSEVADQLAGPQVRNLATLGGNLVNASPAGDLINPLLVLDATLVLLHMEGGEVLRREVPLHGFYTGPRATVIGPTELLAQIRVPRPAAGLRATFEKFGTRPAMECSLVTVGARARPDAQGRLCDVRVAFGALGPTPLRGRATEAALEGRPLCAETLAAAQAAARSEVRPISDVRAGAAYRLELTTALLARALRHLVGEEPPRPRPAWLGFRAQPGSRTAAGAEPDPARAVEATQRRVIHFTLNDERVEAEVGPRQSLVDLLRDRFGLLGTKVGCGAGECGTCTVLLDGAAVNACLILAIACDGVVIRTIEGLRRGEGLTPLQQAFVQGGAVQCGFCTPGMIVEAHWLRSLGLPLDEALVRRGIEGNLCRCTGYLKIVEAIQAAPPVAATEDRAPARLA